jgi:hypothetical protein
MRSVTRLLGVLVLSQVPAGFALGGVILAVRGESVPGASLVMIDPETGETAPGGVDLSDAVYVLTYLFLGGPAPAAPFPGCGLDLAASGLSCASFAACP